jgi:hypothetical protein
MIFAQHIRSDAEKIFLSVRNITGATVSANTGVEWEVATVTDGNAVSATRSGSLAGMFAGVVDKALTDSAYGLIQVYGFRTSAYISAASAGCSPGTFLQPTLGIFTDMTMSAATTSGHTKVVLFETIAAAAGNSATLQWNVFIRALG